MKKNIKDTKTKQAFTLIELLVVIAIIGLLAAVTVGSMQKARERGEAARVIGDIKIIKGALQFRYSELAEYPTEEALELEYPTLTGTKTIPGMITADVFDGKFTSAPIPRIGSGQYVYDADGSDGSINYDIEDCGSYTSNGRGVNIIISNAIATHPNVVSQLDELIDAGDGLDCGIIRRGSATSNAVIYNISVTPTQFP